MVFVIYNLQFDFFYTHQIFNNRFNAFLCLLNVLLATLDGHHRVARLLLRERNLTVALLLDLFEQFSAADDEVSMMLGVHIQLDLRLRVL